MFQVRNYVYGWYLVNARNGYLMKDFTTATSLDPKHLGTERMKEWSGLFATEKEAEEHLQKYLKRQQKPAKVFAAIKTDAVSVSQLKAKLVGIPDEAIINIKKGKITATVPAKTFTILEGA